MRVARLYISAVLLFSLFVSLLGVFADSVLAAPSYTMNYQGKLTTPAGVAVTNGNYNMRFFLYTSPTGGSPIWTETRTGGDRVTVSNGLFSVMLGSVTSLTSIDFDQPLYLAVEIGGTGTPAWDGEMSPRKSLGTVPSAFEARQLGGVASTSFLRSDAADSASGLLTFTGGLISTASSTINRLSFTNATGTSLFIGGDRITDFVGSGLTLSGTTLTASLGTDITAAEIANGDHGFFSYASGVATLDTGGLTSANLSAAITDETGTGNAVFSNSPTLVTPNLGTPSTLTLTNATGLPISGITGLGTNIGTWLATPSSANLAAALTDETGTGVAVFGTSPTFTTSANFGTAGVRLSDDGDGALTFLGLGDGNDEDLTLNLDDTANTGVFTSSTGLNVINFSGIGLQESGSNVLSVGDLDTCAEFAALGTLETGTCGSVVLSGSPTITTPTIETSLSVTGPASSASLTLAGDLGQFITLGNTGVRIFDDEDGAITFLGLGDGSDENLTLNLDDTSNTGVFTSSTGLNKVDFSGIQVEMSGTNPQFLADESATEFLRVGVGETAERAVVGWDDSDTLQLGVYDSPTDTTINSLLSIGSTGATSFTPLTTFTTGTGISYAASGATTLSGAYTGLSLDLRTSFTATGQSMTGLRAQTANVANTGSGTYNYFLADLGTSGATLTQSSAAGTNNWRGLNVTTPNITQTTGSVTASGAFVTTGTITTNGTQNGLSVAGQGVGAGTLNAINVANITGAAGTENAINIGTGYDNIFNSTPFDIAGTGATTITPLTTFTTGNILSLGAGGATTLTGDYTGVFVDLSQGFTTTNHSVNGYRVVTPVVVNTGASTYTYRGLTVTGQTTTQNTAAGNTTFTGAFITNSDIIQTTGTVSANGVQVTTGSITTGGTQNGFLVSALGVGAGSLNGVNISNITAGAGTEYAINIGTGWDRGINSLTTGTNYFAGSIGIGTTSPNALFGVQRTGFSTNNGVGLTDQWLQTTGNTNGGTQYANRQYLLNGNTATTTLVSNLFRVEDSTTFGNTVRGIEVQTNRGTNTRGENTAISGTGRTFGIRGITEGDAGASFEPAGGFFQTRGTTQGNAIRGYSASITTATLFSLFHDTSAFTGTGLEMNFGNTTGSFTGTNARFIDLQNAGTSVFTVGAFGTTTIGNGTNYAGLQIGRGGICVDNDGACVAGVAGRMASVSTFTGNSDLAEMYFSSTPLETGEVVTLEGGLSIDRATKDSDTPILGVVSTKPGLLLGFDDTSLQAGETGYPVALKGRVPVKLSTENGPIRRGDMLAMSSIPGVAMKASSTGATIGIALEDFDETRMYSETYVNQFSDDIANDSFVPIETNTDPRINDGCYYGGGTDAGTRPCRPLTTTTPAEQVAEANDIARNENKERVIRELRSRGSQTRTLADGRQVTVGQVVMFVDLDYRWLDDTQMASVGVLFGSEAITNIGENENETVFDRLVTLANNFVDGVLSVLSLKAERVEVSKELCVDGVCVNADDLRRLLDEGGIPPPTNTPPPQPQPEPTPEPTPSPSPEPEPEIIPAPAPIVEEPPAPQPEPEIVPEPEPEPQPEPTPEPEPSPEPPII